MESRQILVVSPYKRMTPLIESYCREFNIKTLILDCFFDDAVSKIRGILAENPNAISLVISRGATLKLLERKLRDVPRVSIDPSEYDLFLALAKAKKANKRIGILIFDSDAMHIAEQAAQLLNLEVSIYSYSTRAEFENQVKKLVQDNIGVVIGGGDALLSRVKELNIEYIPLLTSEVTIKRALNKAREIINAAQIERENAKQLQTIIEYTHTGIIATDEKGKITIFNPIAAKTFGLNKSEVIGKTLDELTDKKYLVGMFSDVSEHLDYIYKTKNTVLLLNRVPIYIQEEFKGTLISFKDITTIQEEESKIRKEIYAKGFVAKFHFDDIIYTSGKMSNIIEKAKRFANSDCTVLLQGDSGTGKELIAQSIHNAHSTRGARSFVAVNCASLDNNLLKSELFGYVEGAFTGAAKKGRAGLFELAHGGTIFLDEIGKIKLDIQAILLRVIQEKEIIRIGSDRVIPVDVRIVAATNEDLEKLIEKGQFLQDLYFRLNVLKLKIPTLKERREDIPFLVKSMLDRLSDNYEKKIKTFQSIVYKKLMELDWPGNIRQLEYLIERCVVLADNEQDASRVMIELIDEEFSKDKKDDAGMFNECFGDTVTVKIDTLQNMEKEIVRKLALKDKQTRTELALRLGISRPTLWKILGDKNTY